MPILEGFLDQPHLVILLHGLGGLLNNWKWLHIRLHSLYFFSFDLLCFFLYLKYRLFDVGLISLLGYLKLWVDSRWENFGLGFKYFSLPFNNLLNDHLVSY